MQGGIEELSIEWLALYTVVLTLIVGFVYFFANGLY